MDSVQEGPAGDGAVNGSSSIEFARRAALLATDLRCEDVRLLDVRGLSQICVFIPWRPAPSRQMRSVAEDMEELAEVGYQRFRVTGDSLDTGSLSTSWMSSCTSSTEDVATTLENLWTGSVDIDFGERIRSRAQVMSRLASDFTDLSSTICP